MCLGQLTAFCAVYADISCIYCLPLHNFWETGGYFLWKHMNSNFLAYLVIYYLFEHTNTVLLPFLFLSFFFLDSIIIHFYCFPIFVARFQKF